MKWAISNCAQNKRFKTSSKNIFLCHFLITRTFIEISIIFSIDHKDDLFQFKKCRQVTNMTVGALLVEDQWHQK